MNATETTTTDDHGLICNDCASRSYEAHESWCPQRPAPEPERLDWNGIQYLARLLDLERNPSPSKAEIERQARWLRDKLHIGGIADCRAMLAETISVWAKWKANRERNGD